MTEGPAPTAAAPSLRDLELRVGGRRLAARWVAPAHAAAAPPLVLLHEGLGSIGQWSRRGLDVPARLAEATGRAVFLYDRLGFGRSDPLPGPRGADYLYREAWDALPEVLDRADIRTAVLIGHSDGATIALLFAARHPERTACVVSEAAHVIVEPETLAGIRAARAAYAAPDGKLKSALERHHGSKTDDLFRNWAGVWLQPDFARFDMVAELPRITAPVLAIQGMDDQYGTPRQLELIADNAAGPVVTWLIPDCGHSPHFESPLVLPRIARFVGTAAR